MESSSYLSFILISIGLIIIPGPNVLLIVSNSLSGGLRNGLLTVAGTSTAMSIQLIVTTFAVSSIMVILAQWFEWLRLLGVVYLIYLGIQHWLAKTEMENFEKTMPSKRSFWQGFLVSMTNPKTLLFFAAFLPQFVNPAQAMLPQMVMLSITFLVLATILDTGYIFVGEKLRRFFYSERRLKIRNRFIGTLFMGAGLSLALARRGS